MDKIVFFLLSLNHLLIVIEKVPKILVVHITQKVWVLYKHMMLGPRILQL